MANQTDEKLITRPPVIVVMGHIDHGKSSLLDFIRKSNVVAGEAGSITQNLSAYEVVHKNKSGKESKITFLDTPGHEAFKTMRSRGAKTADIAILVVSAEEGVKQQTLEALESVKESNIPYIVAINKIDKPNADVEKTKQNLAESGIYLEGYGGDVPFVPISAKTGQGIDELLDIILLVAEIGDYKADPNASPKGTIIEAHLDKTKGISATLVIKNGTIKSGECIVSGKAIAPVRIMEDYTGKKISEATFSSPVTIIGWDNMPEIGGDFSIFSCKKEAISFIEEMLNEERSQKKSESRMETFEEGTYFLPIILKSENIGTLEALKSEIKKAENDRVKFKIISEGVGEINENDLKQAQTKAGTVVVGFATQVDKRAQSIAEKFGIKVGVFDIIYKATEWLQEIATVSRPTFDSEEERGKSKILKVFSSNKNKHVVGGRVESGSLSVGARIKLLRRNEEISQGNIKELQTQKVKVSQVNEGDEFGALIESKIEPVPGDVISAFEIVNK